MLKNAIDYLLVEWQHKPAGFVSDGLAGGVRAAEHLRLVLSEVKAVPVSSQVALSAERRGRVQPSAVELYERLGFTMLGTVPGIPAPDTGPAGLDSMYCDR